jgi:hypothetical protein
MINCCYHVTEQNRILVIEESMNSNTTFYDNAVAIGYVFVLNDLSHTPILYYYNMIIHYTISKQDTSR